jgi:hypothetical protein
VGIPAAREDLGQLQPIAQRDAQAAEDHPAQDLNVATEALIRQARDQDSRRAAALRDVDGLT